MKINYKYFLCDTYPDEIAGTMLEAGDPGTGGISSTRGGV